MLRREENLKSCFVLRAGTPEFLPWSIIHKKFEVVGPIRVHAKDYQFFPEGKRYTHFNLEHSNHRPGKKYILPKIVQSGYYRKNGDELLPLLDFSDCFIAICISVRERVSYQLLTTSDFTFSLTNIKNLSSLQKEILWRYNQSLPDISDEEILSRGVSITELEIIGKTPLCAF